MITGSLQLECNTRLTNLYNKHNGWLVNEAKKVTKNQEEAEDLCSELFEYLHLKCNPKIIWVASVLHKCSHNWPCNVEIRQSFYVDSNTKKVKAYCERKSI